MASLFSVELPTYELLISNGGPKIQRSDDQTPPIPAQPTNEPVAPTGRQGVGPPPTPPRGTLSMFGTQYSSTLQGKAVPLSCFAGGLAIQLRRAVVDKTNLKGLYDFKLQWTPDPIMLGIASPGAQAAGSTGPSIFTAIQEQLGLKLESSKGTVEVLVIASVSKPSEN